MRTNHTHHNLRSSKNSLPINDQIRVSSVMLIDDETGERGIVPTAQAAALAHERQLDLVLVAPMANPPVARVMDYGKYRYEQEKNDRKQRKSQKANEVKEIRLTALMEEHDREQRLKRAAAFIADGHRVKLSMRFAGRQMIFREKGLATLRAFATALNMQFETEPRFAGKIVNVQLIPAKDAQSQNQTKT